MRAKRAKSVGKRAWHSGQAVTTDNVPNMFKSCLQVCVLMGDKKSEERTRV